MTTERDPEGGEGATDSVRDEVLTRAFPALASLGTVDRRAFLKLMGASLALAGVSACGARPAAHIVPYVHAPDARDSSEDLYYATVMPQQGFATGLLVKSVAGRPIKVEGNLRHPASHGGTDVFTQAAVLTLFDPDRSQTVRHRGRPSTWEACLGELDSRLSYLAGRQGDGLRILTETVTSPTLNDQLQQLSAAFPKAQWHQYEPFAMTNVDEGLRLAFGRPLSMRYDFSRADIIVSLDADFLTAIPGRLAYARQFIGRRRDPAAMNRLYVTESTWTLSGAMADHRTPMRAVDVEAFAHALAHALGIVGRAPAAAKSPPWTLAVIDDLRRHPGHSVILAGPNQPPAVHALVAAMNASLRNIGSTVLLSEPIARQGAQSLEALTKDMLNAKVNTLFILGGNPVLTAPRDVHFGNALQHVEFSLALGLYADETAERVGWHVPAAHFLESWSDARAYDGTISLIQPLIAPLYGGKTPHELLAALMRRPETTSHDIVRRYWSSQQRGGDFGRFWETTLREGVISNTTTPVLALSPTPDFAQHVSPPQPTSGLELQFRPDPNIGDGRDVNNAWLQELPKPFTKLTWDNAALISPALAQARGLQTGDVVWLRFREHALMAPVFVLPGQPDDSVTVTVGYGRAQTGGIGANVGFDPYGLRTSGTSWFGGGLEIHKTGQRHAFATTQEHHRMEGRDLVRMMTAAAAAQARPERGEKEPSLYPDYPYPDVAWGMAIDIGSCIGCNACVVACQAENNIPVVGQREVMRGHEMHWLRVDSYFQGQGDQTAMLFQPVPCMHCEKAPCELVCPVAATVHDFQGLNLQVYNRCIGTRFCSNNCPYKVRRFNWFRYIDPGVESLKAVRNPDVTVRDRGVMEKCTYCIQRIAAARIRAAEENRPIRDGEVQTACQQACPTQAITFGNINDPASVIARQKSSPLNYALLEELGTRPRTTYLARIINPNPDLEKGGGA